MFLTCLKIILYNSLTKKNLIEIFVHKRLQMLFCSLPVCPQTKSLRGSVPNTVNMYLGRCPPWTLHRLNYSSLGWLVPWTLLPLVIQYLTNVSWPFGTDCPMMGKPLSKGWKSKTYDQTHFSGILYHIIHKMMIWGSFSFQTSSLSLYPSGRGSILFDKVQLL